MMTDRFETFAMTISVMNRCIQKIKAREMAAVGLKSTHTMCLYSLGKAGEGLTAAQLCDICKEDKAAISRSVNELVQRGYVSLDMKSAKRAYRTKILLTPKGRETVEYINRRVEQAMDAVGEGLDENQRELFYNSLSLIAEKLQGYAEDAGVTSN